MVDFLLQSEGLHISVVGSHVFDLNVIFQQQNFDAPPLLGAFLMAWNQIVCAL